MSLQRAREIAAQNAAELKELGNFTTTPYPPIVFALDFAGRLKWRFDIDRRTVMPKVGVDEAGARDIAA